jgi:hypothetical protein
MVGAPRPTAETLKEINTIGSVDALFFFDYMHETWAEEFAVAIAKMQKGIRPRIITPEWARDGLEQQIKVDSTDVKVELAPWVRIVVVNMCLLTDISQGLHVTAHCWDSTCSLRGHRCSPRAQFSREDLFGWVLYGKKTSQCTTIRNSRTCFPIVWQRSILSHYVAAGVHRTPSV